MIFDTHAHYDDEAFELDREEILNQVKQAGVARIVNVGASLKSSEQSIILSEQTEGMYCAVGVHPSEVEQLNDTNFDLLRGWLKHPKVIAVGEIGLDYHWDTPERELQKKWFMKQLKLAIEENYPVIIHSRDAAEDTLTIMRQAKDYATSIGKSLEGVIHCFSYGTEIAKEYLKMGFYLGIGGVVTFKNAKKLKDVVKSTPLERIVLETDCPYLAPEPYRGKRNQSSYLNEVAALIAEIKAIQIQEVLDCCWENAYKLYHIVEK